MIQHGGFFEAMPSMCEESCCKVDASNVDVAEVHDLLWVCYSAALTIVTLVCACMLWAEYCWSLLECQNQTAYPMVCMQKCQVVPHLAVTLLTGSLH
jgi:hypothetical protein